MASPVKGTGAVAQPCRKPGAWCIMLCGYAHSSLLHSTLGLSAMRSWGPDLQQVVLHLKGCKRVACSLLCCRSQLGPQCCLRLHQPSPALPYARLMASWLLQCVGESVKHRVCKYYNLLLWNGTLYYPTTGELLTPLLSMCSVIW